MTLLINASDNKANSQWEFKLIGEVDISNAHQFKKQLEAALSATKQNIAIDLSELNYMDSTGLGVIIGTYGAIKKEGLSIRILNPKENVKKVIRVSGLDRLLSEQ
jgi:anti-sigma B factor antagonist